MKRLALSRLSVMAALVFLAAARAPVAQAAEQCGPDAMRDHPPHISFRADNDLSVSYTHLTLPTKRIV